MEANSSLKNRIISSSVLIIFFVLIVFIFPRWTFALVVTMFIGMGLLEFFNLVELTEIKVYKYFGTVFGILVPIFTFFELDKMTGNLVPFLIVIVCLLMFVLQFERRDNAQALVRISITLFGILYMSWFPSFIIKIRYLENGALLVFFLLLVTKIGDMGSYFIGTAFGKHSLIKHISPKKSIEGTLGGLFFSVVAATVSGLYLHDIGLMHLVILGILLGGLGQLGDLSESLIKRSCQAKDSGRIFSGLGGVLDISDSLLFTIPIFYFYIKLFLQ